MAFALARDGRHISSDISRTFRLRSSRQEKVIMRAAVRD